MMRPILFFATLLVAATPLVAQQASAARAGAAPAADSTRASVPDSTGPLLTLSDALRVARHNNPTFLQSVSARQLAGANVRMAYGQLLPQLSASLGGLYQTGGQSVQFGSFLGASSDYYSSQYQIGLNYTLSAATLLTPSYAKASQNAADANVAGQAESLESGVAQQYVTVLEDQAKAALQDTLVADDQAQLDLSKAKVAVGSATILDQQRAAVTLGQQQVQALQAHNLVDIDKLRLFQQLGVNQPAGVHLEDAFVVTMPTFSLDSVMNLARRQNPQIERAPRPDTCSRRGCAPSSRPLHPATAGCHGHRRLHVPVHEPQRPSPAGASRGRSAIRVMSDPRLDRDGRAPPRAQLWIAQPHAV